jgi:hypothetical protein
VVERLADRDAATEQFLASGLDVGNDQVQALGGAGRRRRNVLAEDDRGCRAGRRELDDAVVVAGGEVGVEPPAQIAVELLGAVDVRNRDHGDLDLHVERPRIRDVDGGGTDLGVHDELLRLGRRPD